MTGDARLEQEADRLAGYLAGTELEAVARGHYVRWHDTEDARGDCVDRLLLAFASIGIPGLALADAYAARFRRAALLRKKLVVVLALVETTAPGFETIDRPLSRGRATFWVRMALRGVVAALLTLCACLLIGPAHLVCRMLGSGEERR